MIGNSENWSDLVLIYKALINNGFEAGNIYVHYDNNLNYNTDLDAYLTPDTNRNSTKTAIEQTFSELDTKMNSTDFLFFWWHGHGLPMCGADGIHLQLATIFDTIAETQTGGFWLCRSPIYSTIGKNNVEPKDVGMYNFVLWW